MTPWELYHDPYGAISRPRGSYMMTPWELYHAPYGATPRCRRGRRNTARRRQTAPVQLPPLPSVARSASGAAATAAAKAAAVAAKPPTKPSTGAPAVGSGAAGAPAEAGAARATAARPKVARKAATVRVVSAEQRCVCLGVDATHLRHICNNWATHMTQLGDTYDTIGRHI